MGSVKILLLFTVAQLNYNGNILVSERHIVQTQHKVILECISQIMPCKYHDINITNMILDTFRVFLSKMGSEISKFKVNIRAMSCGLIG